MLNIPIPIVAPTPTVYPATTYDKWAFTLATSGYGAVEAGEPPSTLAPIVVSITFHKYRDRDDGVSELSPRRSDVVTTAVNDLYGLAAQDAGIGGAMAALVAAVGNYAIAQKLI